MADLGYIGKYDGYKTNIIPPNLFSLNNDPDVGLVSKYANYDIVCTSPNLFSLNSYPGYYNSHQICVFNGGVASGPAPSAEPTVFLLTADAGEWAVVSGISVSIMD